MSEELKANKELVLFENNKIRRQMYNGEWNYSIIDVVAVLTEQKDYEKSILQTVQIERQFLD